MNNYNNYSPNTNYNQNYDQNYQYQQPVHQPNVNNPTANQQYNQQQYLQQNNYVNNQYNQQQNDLVNNFSSMSINQGFNHAMGVQGFNLLSDRNVKSIARTLFENSGTDVIRCTLNKIPETASILQKSRLPLGLLLHPFKDKVRI